MPNDILCDLGTFTLSKSVITKKANVLLYFLPGIGFFKSLLLTFSFLYLCVKVLPIVACKTLPHPVESKAKKTSDLICLLDFCSHPGAEFVFMDNFFLFILICTTCLPYILMIAFKYSAIVKIKCSFIYYVLKFMTISHHDSICKYICEIWCKFKFILVNYLKPRAFVELENWLVQYFVFRHRKKL